MAIVFDLGGDDGINSHTRWIFIMGGLSLLKSLLGFILSVSLASLYRCLVYYLRRN